MTETTTKRRVVIRRKSTTAPPKKRVVVRRKKQTSAPSPALVPSAFKAEKRVSSILNRFPETDNELWWWVYATWGVKIPRTRVCDNHVDFDLRGQP